MDSSNTNTNITLVSLCDMMNKVYREENPKFINSLFPSILITLEYERKAVGQLYKLLNL